MVRLWLLLAVAAGCSFDLDAVERPGGGGATDGGGGSENLVLNGGFEDGTAGWRGDQADIGHEESPHSGAFAAFACARLPPSDSETYAVDDEPDSAPAPEPGTYRAGAWVRADDGSSAQRIDLAIRRGAAPVSEADSVVAGASWVQLEITGEFGAEATLGVELRAHTESDGDCFLVDDVSLVRL